MSTVKDRDSKDLTEAEDIKARWQEYTDKLYKIKEERILTEIKRINVTMVGVSSSRRHSNPKHLFIYNRASKYKKLI